MSSNIADTETSIVIRLRKRGECLRKLIGIIMYFDMFTLMSKSEASCAMSLRMLRGLLIKFL